MASSNPQNPLSGIGKSLSNQAANLSSGAKIQGQKGASRASRLLDQGVKAGLNTALTAVGSPVLAKAANVVLASRRLRNAALAAQAAIYTSTTLIPIAIILGIVLFIYMAVFQAVELLKDDPIKFVQVYGEELKDVIVDVALESGVVDCAWESGKSITAEAANTAQKAQFISVFYTEELVGGALDAVGLVDKDDAHIITGSDTGRAVYQYIDETDPGDLDLVATCLSQINTNVIISRLVETPAFLLNPTGD